MTLQTLKIFLDIEAERLAQSKKWGRQHHTIGDWMMILGEEYGEACKEGCTYNFGNSEEIIAALPRLRMELIQVAAVAVQIIEEIDERIDKA